MAGRATRTDEGESMDGTTGIRTRRFVMLAVLATLLTALSLVAFSRSVPAPESTGWLMVLVLPAVLAASLPPPAYRIVLGLILVALPIVVLPQPLPSSVAMLALLVNGASVAAAATVTRQLVRSTNRALDRIRRRGEIDPLTEVMNRRGLERAVAERHTATDEVTVALVDLDHLKHLNDHHGHDCGDQALLQVARNLRRAAPAGLVARLGGDEFLVVVDAAEDAGLADRIRSGLTPGTNPVTVSIGCATGPVGAPRLDRLVKQADLALYRDKSINRPLPDRPARATDDDHGPQAEQDAFGRATRRLLALVAATFALLTLPAIAFSDELAEFGETIRPSALLISMVLDLVIVGLLLRPGPNRRTVAPALVVALASIAVMTLSGSGQFLATAVWVVPLLPAFQVLGRPTRTVVFVLVLVVRTWIVVQQADHGPAAGLVAGVQLAVLVAVVGWLWRLHVRSGRVLATLDRLSSTDPLTGLLNRGGVERTVADRGWGWVTVTMFDVDRFKAVNDQKGHAAGDLLLVELADELRRLSPDDAVIGRLGGDEFVVVTAGPAGPDAVGDPWPVPVTSGTAAGPVPDADALWELLRRADLDLIGRRRDRTAALEDHS